MESNGQTHNVKSLVNLTLHTSSEEVDSIVVLPLGPFPPTFLSTLLHDHCRAMLLFHLSYLFPSSCRSSSSILTASYCNCGGRETATCDIYLQRSVAGATLGLPPKTPGLAPPPSLTFLKTSRLRATTHAFFFVIHGFLFNWISI